jgi:hypothetical protein
LQQERRRELKDQLDVQLARAEAEDVPATESPEQDAETPVEFVEAAGALLVPEFTPVFRASCAELPTSLVGRALRAAVGFAAHDPGIWRHTVRLEGRPNTVRIRIGIHYRLMLEWLPGKSLRVLDLIPRAELESWIRRHAGS